jgi:hypothetical protein
MQYTAGRKPRPAVFSYSDLKAELWYNSCIGSQKVFIIYKERRNEDYISGWRMLLGTAEVP